MIENIKEKVKQAYQNDKLLYPLVDEMCEEINGTETDVENLEVTDLGSGNASAGKVATADGSGNVEWQNVPNELPSHGEGDVGKVLKVGSEGVEWGAAGTGEIWASIIKAGNALYTVIGAKITTKAEFAKWLYDNNFRSSSASGSQTFPGVISPTLNSTNTTLYCGYVGYCNNGSSGKHNTPAVYSSNGTTLTEYRRGIEFNFKNDGTYTFTSVATTEAIYSVDIWNYRVG